MLVLLCFCLVAIFALLQLRDLILQSVALIVQSGLGKGDFLDFALETLYLLSQFRLVVFGNLGFQCV